MMIQGLICIFPFSKLMHAQVFIRSFSRNDKYHSFIYSVPFKLQYLFRPFQEMINIIPLPEMINSHHTIFSIIFKNNILLFVPTHKWVPSFREYIFLLGKGRPAAVPFPASSSLTPHHFLSTGSMAASSASAVCAVCLEVTDVLRWFSDPIQRMDVFDRFVKAQSATELHPDAWAREKWVRACKNFAGSDGDGSGAVWPGLRNGPHSSGAA
jgi:hypothetical protein